MALLQQKNPASRPFSDEKNTAHLKEQYQKLRLYMPEEDHYVAVMQSDPIDDAAKCPREEQDRRKKIKATEFFVKLEVDQQLLKSRSAKMPMASRYAALPRRHHLRVCLRHCAACAAWGLTVCAWPTVPKARSTSGNASHSQVNGSGQRFCHVLAAYRRRCRPRCARFHFRVRR